MSTSPPEAAAAKHLLFVDDYVDTLEVFTVLLEMLGYSVETAETGSAALQAVARRVPAAIVLDLQLPDISGLDVARSLRANAVTAGVPLIAMTGRAITRDGADELRHLFDAIMIKPCEPKQLIKELERLIDPPPPTSETTA
jgi:two-component system, sensor histidine kinase ChiS